MFQGNGYYFNGANGDYLEDVYGRHLIREGSNGLWSQFYLTNSTVPPCGSIVGNGMKFCLSANQDPMITGKLIFHSRECPNLTNIECFQNHISVLDVSQLVRLKIFWCYSNLLSALNITPLTELEIFGCHFNQITALDISHSTKMVTFYCNSNRLPTLNVSKNSLLTTLKCSNNLMGQSAVDKVLCDANAWNTSDGILDISGNTAPSSTGTDCKNNLVNRNWTVTTD